MADMYLVTHSDMTGVAEEIRAKSGKTDSLTFPDGWKEAVKGLSSEEQLKANELPDYVRTEATEVAAKVRAVLKEDSIVSIKLSDSHYVGETATAANDIQTDESNLRACMAVKALTYLLPVDYIAHLGDVGKGTFSESNPIHKKELADYMGFFREAVGSVPVFVAIGNHDTAIYYHNKQTDGGVHTLPGDWLYDNLTALAESDNTVVSGQSCGGYLYRDFPDKKLRVFLVNTSENLIVNQYDNGTSETQQLWMAQALKNLNTKTDASEWGFVVLSHYALDYGDVWRISRVFKSYVAGESITLGGTTVNFSGSNAAKFYAQFHGHFHCFNTDSLHCPTTNDPNTMQPYGIWRLCTPNAGYNAENNYNTKTFYGINFGETTTYAKNPDTANDTSFVVDVITPSEQAIHSFAYGAGYDRTLSLAGDIYHSVSKNLTNATLTVESTNPVKTGGSYSATIAATDGYTLDSVVITMGGVNITASAYNASIGTISIAEVTGMIVITAVASKLVTYTNLLPTAQVFTNGDSSALDGVGYRDGYYLSSSSGVGSAYSGYVCTGLIPYARKTDGTFPTIYIKGCEWAQTGQCRLYYYSATKSPITTSTYGGTATNGNVEKWQTITKLGDKYYSFDSNSTMDAAPQQPAYIAFSFKGSGKDLIITFDELIE